MQGIFKSGDRVRPSKGGPVMEVKGYDDQDKVICSWYETRQGWKKQSFTEQALRRVRRSRTAAGS
jgi:uncharacterized protein YodC (DUF2158 family)